MAVTSVIAVFLAVFVAGLTLAAVGVGLMFANANPVGGGCTNTNPPSGPIVCSNPTLPAQFLLGELLSGVGTIVAMTGGVVLRSEGWVFPWRRSQTDREGIPPGACANCGTANPSSGLFCSACGFPLASNS